MPASEPPHLTFVHASGLEVVVRPSRAAPVVAVQVWVKVGSGDEGPNESGLAHIHEHMLFKGTARRGVGEVARAVEASGGSINAWTSFDQTVYHIVAPSRFADEAAEVLLDAVFNSAFDADELGRELEVIREEILRSLDAPSRVLSNAMFAEAFRVHPYGRPVIGSEASVAATTRNDVLRFFRRWYHPANMLLVVAGDVGVEQVERWVEAAVPRDLPAFAGRPGRAAEPPQAETRLLVRSRECEHSLLQLAFRAPALRHDDTVALELLWTILGQGDSSRLFEVVQRRMQLVDGVSASLYSPAEPGLAFVGASFAGGEQPADPLPVLEAIVREVALLRHCEVSGDELARARTLLRSETIYGMQTAQGIAQRLGYYASVAGDLAYEEQILAVADRITPGDLLRVARTYLVPSALTVGLLVSPGADEEALRTRLAEAIPATFARVAAELTPPAWSADAHGVLRAVLPSGLTLLVQRDASTPAFSVRAAVPAGLLFETARDNGVSHLTSLLLTEGTSSRDASSIARELDDLAASMSGFSGRSSLGLSMTALSRDFSRAIALFAECLFDPAFPAAEVERLRREVLQEIASRRDNLGASVFDLFHRRLHAGHAYARPVSGEATTVAALQRGDLEALHAAAVRPERMFVAVVGDVDPDAVYRLVEAGFAARRPCASPLPMPPAPSQPAPNPATRIDEARSKQQSHIVLGFAAPAYASADRLAIEVLASVLGGQGGRLFLELRDRRSLCYSVGAYLTPGYDVGSFAVYMATSPAKVPEAIEAIRSELQRIRDEGVSDAERLRATRSLAGLREIGLQRPGARAAVFVADELLGVGYDECFRVSSALAAIGGDEIRRVAGELLRSEFEVVATLGPHAA
jgi:zinc protease